MGILANHVPSIEPLRPGVVEVIESGNASKKWFGEWHKFHSLGIPFLTRSMFLNQVSGGFATVHPNNKLTINAVEAAPLDTVSAEVSLIYYAHFVYKPNRSGLYSSSELTLPRPRRSSPEMVRRSRRLRLVSRLRFTRLSNTPSLPNRL